MKLTMNLLLLLSFLQFSCDDDKDNDVAPDSVPEAVKTTFAANFPNTVGLEWEKIDEDYEADFDVDTVDHEALISANGEMLKYKFDITEAELPDAVKTAISQNYTDMRLDDAEKVLQGSDAYYQVELDSSGTDKKLVFSAEGQEQTQPAYWD
jgi:hypothetical protein